MGSTELPTATMALGLPRRRARRRYRAPRKVSVCVALNTIRPRVPASQGLPLPRALLRDLPADWWVCGQNLAHDTRCAAVGNRAMSTPISAISSAAGTVGTGDVSELGRLAGERANCLRDAGIQRGDLGADPVDVVQHHLQDRGVVVGEDPAQRLLQPVGFLAGVALGQPGQ